MRLKDMYEAAFRAGMAADPRGEAGVGRVLAKARKDFDKLPEDKRWEFDQERLVNPFADTRILYGDPETEVSSILVGIDLEVGEVLLADRLREKGRPVDLHVRPPSGRAGRSPVSTRSWACRPMCGASSGYPSPTGTRS